MKNPNKHTNAHLEAENLSVGYGSRLVISDADLSLLPGQFTAIVGPNGCGKSTLLKAFGRILSPKAGVVTLDGTDVKGIRGKTFAQVVGLLAQSPETPGAITVADLVSRGRYPYQTLVKQWSSADADAVWEALELVGVADLAQRQVEELSGGQRQRVWIAMVLAQQTDVILLDEPTTFLDLSHQIEVLNLCARLHARGRTLVAVLHDLNMAARYATHMVVMKDGTIRTQGAPSQVLNSELLQQVFSLSARVIADPETGSPLVIPHAPEILSRNPQREKEESWQMQPQ